MNIQIEKMPARVKNGLVLSVFPFLTVLLFVLHSFLEVIFIELTAGIYNNVRILQIEWYGPSLGWF